MEGGRERHRGRERGESDRAIERGYDQESERPRGGEKKERD